MRESGLPHPLLVDLARRAVADGSWSGFADHVADLARARLQPVVNATGVLLHTNLGRAPVAFATSATATNVEFDLSTGARGSRQAGIGSMLARLSGAEAAIVVNNNAAAVMLVLATLASGCEVLVSRGESVEIGGGFRVPDVLDQSGARLVDVGTTNRTKFSDYAGALTAETALVLKVHASNFRIEGFTEETPVAQLAALPVPVIADIGSGLIDADCPWLPGPPPAWLRDEPAARQTLAAGAALVTFSADKLLGGPQAGIIAGRADLVAACARHPLMRALRPGTLVLAALQATVTSYLADRVVTDVPFWGMVGRSVGSLEQRAASLVRQSGVGTAVALEALPGAGSLPGRTIASFGVAVPGDHAELLRRLPSPVVARVTDSTTLLDLRSVDPGDDDAVLAALVAIAACES
jgi:L-seryl-tRNA(Ser) seleniumtransferase